MVFHALHSSPWLRQLSGLLASSLVSCAGSTSGSRLVPPASISSNTPETTRYRLRLHDNPVDSAQAFHCYTACQSEGTPEGYLRCLEACPGFETTANAACTPAEVPPEAACFTVRSVDRGTEPQPGTIIIGVVAGVALVVGLASVCASAHSQCYGVPEAP